MRRVLLLLTLLPLPIHAAPRLKDKKPAPLSEAARIEQLRAKYERIRMSGTQDEKEKLAIEERIVRENMQILDKLARDPERRYLIERSVQRQREASNHLKDLYDIAMHDRRTAAASGK
jgi:hypothetical protein